MDTITTSNTHAALGRQPRSLLSKAVSIVPALVAIASFSSVSHASAASPDIAPHPSSKRSACASSGGTWTGWGANTGTCHRPNGDTFRWKGGELITICWIGVTGATFCMPA